MNVGGGVRESHRLRGSAQVGLTDPTKFSQCGSKLLNRTVFKKRTSWSVKGLRETNREATDDRLLWTRCWNKAEPSEMFRAEGDFYMTGFRCGAPNDICFPTTVLNRLLTLAKRIQK